MICISMYYSYAIVNGAVGPPAGSPLLPASARRIPCPLKRGGGLAHLSMVSGKPMRGDEELSFVFSKG